MNRKIVALFDTRAQISHIKYGLPPLLCFTTFVMSNILVFKLKVPKNTPDKDMLGLIS
uniref:Uncharacterized protein n=1 Tax=Arion vulgaris TaxID=1028688 RepID=A0A0B6ZXS2_9EUPU